MITSKQAVRRAVRAVFPRCFYCGAPATHTDHIIAKANGGECKAENYVSSCAACNCSKGSKHHVNEKEARVYAFISAPLISQVAEQLKHNINNL